MTIVIGEVDVGKTTLITGLANLLAGRGLRVGIVDADIGQSEIGPPTTVGLGRVNAPLRRPADVDLVALHFVGATSAARDQAATVVGAKRLVERALALGLDRVLVDTSGLVRGDLGRRLKQAKIDVLGPDLIVALQRERECDLILAPYDVRASRVERLPPATAARPRNPEQRRRFRDAALARHFEGARAVELDLSRVVLQAPPLFLGEPAAPDVCHEATAIAQADVVWAERLGRDWIVVTPTPLDERAVRALARHWRATAVMHHTIDDVEGRIAGLADAALDTLGLGAVTRIDFAGRTLTVDTAVDTAGIAVVTIGRERCATRAG